MGNKLKNDVMPKMSQRYEIVEARTIQDLVRLVNLKTKADWVCIGGMVYTPTNFCVIGGDFYPYCQTVIKYEVSKKSKK